MFFRQLSNAFSYLDLLDNVATILGPECRIFSRIIRNMDALRVIHPKALQIGAFQRYSSL